MRDHLWLKNPRPPAPWQYIELILCRDVYHCTPSQLRQEAAADIFAHLAMLEAEAEVREREDQAAKSRSKRRA